MENILDTLNEKQREAAETIDRPVRIIAGAGSGKTRVLMARIAYLIEEIGILPFRILAITFTNKAAKEMKDRLYSLIGDQAKDVRISTIHSLAVRMLREDAQSAGYPKNFAILDPDDQKSLINPYYRKHKIQKKEISPASVLSYISKKKTAGISPEEAKEAAEVPEAMIYADFYSFYQDQLFEKKAMDFDDLLINAEHLLKTNKEIRTKWQNRLDYIHVDEFQDVDPIQYSMIRFLSSPNSELCVVGDPDQTIYTWRGASVDIILRFDKDFPDSKTVILDQNYRSTKAILDASNALIANNKGRIKKDLFSNREGDEKIVEYEGDSDDDEALFIAKEILRLHGKKVPYKEIAVLYRANYLSRTFEKALRQAGIPYIVYGGIRFFERAEIKDILSYLRMTLPPNEEDPKQISMDLPLKRIINNPRRGIGDTTLARLEDLAESKNINMYTALSDTSSFASGTAKKLNAFHNMIEKLKKELENHTFDEYVDVVLDVTGYRKMLENAHEEDRLDNLMELREDMAQSMLDNPETTLESYLEDIAIYTNQVELAVADSVSLMTIHSAKGLEFDYVFIGGLNDGIFPSQRSVNESRAGLEEERRLMYVAMTRARKKLFITYSSGFSFNMDTVKTPSRFLLEVPDKYIEGRDMDEAVSDNSQPRKPSRTLNDRRVKKTDKYRNGDLVNHKKFGEGVVMDVKGPVVTIAFMPPVGMKKIRADAGVLSKK